MFDFFTALVDKACVLSSVRVRPTSKLAHLGCKNYHLHQFYVGLWLYGAPDPDAHCDPGEFQERENVDGWVSPQQTRLDLILDTSTVRQGGQSKCVGRDAALIDALNTVLVQSIRPENQYTEVTCICHQQPVSVEQRTGGEVKCARGCVWIRYVVLVVVGTGAMREVALS